MALLLREVYDILDLCKDNEILEQHASESLTQLLQKEKNDILAVEQEHRKSTERATKSKKEYEQLIKEAPRKPGLEKFREFVRSFGDLDDRIGKLGAKFKLRELFRLLDENPETYKTFFSYLRAWLSKH